MSLPELAMSGADFSEAGFASQAKIFIDGVECTDDLIIFVDEVNGYIETVVEEGGVIQIDENDPECVKTEKVYGDVRIKGVTPEERLRIASYASGPP